MITDRITALEKEIMTAETGTEMTDWFPAEVKPVHVGVYETNMGLGNGFSHWDGKAWGAEYLRLDDALLWSPLDVGRQQKKWRGLRNKP